MTYAGMRDLIFQVDDAAGFARVYAGWAPGAGKVELVQSAGWGFFDDKVRPKPPHRAWISNNRVVMELVKHGSDPRKPHVLDHTFLGPSDALDGVADFLQENGFTDQARPAADQLVVHQSVALDPDEITTWTLRFGGLAEQSGADYDGWGAAIVR